MSVSQLTFVWSLQAVVTPAIAFRFVLESNIRDIPQGQKYAEADGTKIDDVACSIRRSVLRKICEGRNEGSYFIVSTLLSSIRAPVPTTIPHGYLEPQSCGFRCVRRQIVAQPRQYQRTAGKRASSHKECASVLDGITIACQLHNVSNCSQEQSAYDQRSSHRNPVTCPCECDDAKEGQEVWWYREELCGHFGVAETLDDGRQEEREGIYGHQDEEEVE